MYACICMYVYVCMYMYACIYMYVYVCMYVCVYMYVCLYVCVCVYAYMYMYVCMIYWGNCPGGNVLPKSGGGIAGGIVQENCPGGVVLHPTKDPLTKPPDKNPREQLRYNLYRGLLSGFFYYYKPTKNWGS